MASTNRILVGIDGSEGSKAALRWAVAEAKERGWSVQAITVWQSPFRFGDTFLNPVDETKLAKGAQDLLDRTIAEVVGDNPQIGIETAVVEGDPALILCRRSSDVQLLVVGALGHSPLASVALGSVATRCAGCSQCPVLVVPKGGGSSRTVLEKEHAT